MGSRIMKYKIFVSTVFFVGFGFAVWKFFGFATSPRNEVENIYFNCMKSMEKGVCNLQSPRKPSSEDFVLIAGYGKLGALEYDRLAKMDSQMCLEIKGSCAQSKESNLCKLGRALYKSR